MKVMNCETCGNLPMAYLDGYAVGDRLLEGVRFEITLDNGKVKATTHPDAKDYMANLNEKKWLKEAVRTADGYDNLECPNCHGEVAMGMDEHLNQILRNIMQ